jgi:Tol biopolymer transport system component/DNA-binding winged helix-turn-helix (wHTH) protein
MADIPAPGRIRFAGFEADLASRELFSNGVRISLPNQSFVALAALLERPGELVTREALRQRLWPDDRVVEFDQGLNAIINRLREALSAAAPDGARLIETLPRRGYRFTGRVETAHPRSRSRALYVVAALLVAGTAVTLMQRRGPSQELRIYPLTSLEGREISPTLSVGGDSLLFAWNGAPDLAGHFELYRKRLDSERLERVTHTPATALQAIASPQGSIFVSRRTEQASGVFLLGASGTERVLAAADFLNEPYMQLGLSPDGATLGYAAVEADGWSHLHLLTLSKARTRVLDRPESCADAGLPAFSSDGRWLAYVCTTHSSAFDLELLDLSSGATRRLASIQGVPQGTTFEEPQSILIASNAGFDSGIWRVTLAGRASRLVRPKVTFGPGITASAGRIGFVDENRTFDLWRASLGAVDATNFAPSSRSQLVPAYSPDGKRLAFESDRSGSEEIWVADADGKDPVKLTAFEGAATGAPSWCADGRRLAFDSRAAGPSAIYLLDLFEGHARLLQTTVLGLALPVWSEDCQWIIASDGRETLYRIPAIGGPAARFTDRHAYRAVVVGSRVLFNVSGPEGVELWAKPLHGGIEAPLPGMRILRYADAWTATSRGVFFTAADGDSSALSVYEQATQTTRVVQSLPGGAAALGGLGLAVSPDGQHFVYTREHSLGADIVAVRP